MKLTVLTDNIAGQRFLAEHGLSYLIDIDGEKILFDTGYSDVFIQNATKLGIDLATEVEKIVLSHGHWDHGDGLQFLHGKTLITHPDAFVNRFRKKDNSPTGLKLSRETVAQKFELIESKKPLKITPNLFFLGEIPRMNDFESQKASNKDILGNDDFIPDDSAVVAIVKNEMIIVTGCSHSGICNICEQAKKVTGISKINTVIGGFHIKKQDFQTIKTVEYFFTNQPANLLPSHCTELPALSSFHKAFRIGQVKTGMTFSF